MERPHNSSGCLENEDLENDDRRPGQPSSLKPELIGGSSWFYNLTG